MHYQACKRANGTIRDGITTAVLALTFNFCGNSAAQAQASQPQQNVFTLQAGGGEEYDSNVFRLPDSADNETVLGTTGRADWITQGYVGLQVDKPYHQQEFRLNASAYKYWYQQFSYLNFDATDFKGNWLWHFTPELSGNLSADRQQQLINYADYTDYTQRNVQTTYDYVYTLDWQAFGGWHTVGSAALTGRHNSFSYTAQSSYRSDYGEAGFKYVLRSGSYIEAVAQRTYGVYLDQPLDEVNLIDTGYHENGGELRFKQFSPPGAVFSGIYLAAGYLSRVETNIYQRDYDGWTAHFQGAWNPTQKIAVKLSGGRDVSQYTTAYSSYDIINSLSLTPQWAVSDKVTVRAEYDYSIVDYEQAVLPSPSGRKDILHTYQLGLEWTPYRFADISAVIQDGGRLSSYVGTDYQYRDWAGSLSVSLQFGK